MDLMSLFQHQYVVIALSSVSKTGVMMDSNSAYLDAKNPEKVLIVSLKVHHPQPPSVVFCVVMVMSVVPPPISTTMTVEFREVSCMVKP